MSARFVVLGLARPRSAWFTALGRWATSGSAPIEFIRCVSREEVVAHLSSGRAFSALVVDGASLDLDRDLVEVARQGGSATIVVLDVSIRRDWTAMGVHATLDADFGRSELLIALETHATALPRTASNLGLASTNPAADPLGEDDEHGMRPVGRWVSVVGSGSGTSVLAMALAQALGDRRTNGAEVVLADLALDADQAMLHAAPDIVPGVSELVEAYRASRVESRAVRELTFEVDRRHYHLLLGLRRHRDWAALRPRATAAALAGLSDAFGIVVADIDADFEGEADCGVVEIEERNALSRAALQRSDVVAAVGTADLKGLHSLIRLLSRLQHFGVDPSRIVPIINRAPRHPRARAELARAIAQLGYVSGNAIADTPPTGPSVAGPLFVPVVRRLDAILRDGDRLPEQLGSSLGKAVSAMLEERVSIDRTLDIPQRIQPGELGIAAQDRAAS